MNLGQHVAAATGANDSAYTSNRSGLHKAKSNTQFVPPNLDVVERKTVTRPDDIKRKKRTSKQDKEREKIRRKLSRVSLLSILSWYIFEFRNHFISWWIGPFWHGFAEGCYRWMAELIGNVFLSLVFGLNFVYRLLLGVGRQRATSILDGFVLGIRGLIADTLVTPINQCVRLTRQTLHDYGKLWAFVACMYGLLRVPLGPFFGILHFFAAVFEGFANALLQEEAQFAPFEPQRNFEEIVIFQHNQLFSGGETAKSTTKKHSNRTKPWIW